MSKHIMQNENLRHIRMDGSPTIDIERFYGIVNGHRGHKAAEDHKMVSSEHQEARET